MPEARSCKKSGGVRKNKGTNKCICWEEEERMKGTKVVLQANGASSVIASNSQKWRVLSKSSKGPLLLYLVFCNVHCNILGTSLQSTKIQ